MENEYRDHFFNYLPPEKQSFTPVGSRRDKKITIQRNVDAHGQKLSQQYIAAWTKVASDRREVAQKMEFEESEGVLITFKSSHDFKGLLERLDLPSKGIELRSVSYVDNNELATVFIPDKQREYFLESIKKFIELNEPEGDSLYYILDNISEATIKEIWTEPFELPPADEICLWEIWMTRAESDEGVNKLTEYCNKKGIFCYENYIHFNNATVMLVSSTLNDLKDSVYLVSELSELRKASEISYDFMGMNATDNEEFIQNLLDRIKTNESNVLVSILDTGIKQDHSLIRPFIKDEHIKKIKEEWKEGDSNGHGTLMAGVCLYNDLTTLLENTEEYSISYGLESVKIHEDGQPNRAEFIPAITEQAIAITEGDDYKRVYVLSITQDQTDDGMPSSQSAMIDKIAFGYEGESKLIIVSTGNRQEQLAEIETNYLDYLLKYSIKEPAQSWNALVVGGYTELTSVSDETFKGAELLAEKYELSPNSRNSLNWERSFWPIKPDVVAESGNYLNLNGEINSVDDLCVLSTSANKYHQLEGMNGTSSASAQIAKISAELLTKYNNLRPETLKGLIVHSAEWTNPMLKRLNNSRTKDDMESLVRTYGYGVPNKQKALNSLKNSVTLVIEDVIVPFAEGEDKKGLQKANEWKIHQLPWAKEILEDYYDIDVKLCVTLSYFVEPHPSRRGFNNRYLYNSHSLKFGLKRADEDLERFMARYNSQVKVEGKGDTEEGWFLGPNLRGRGQTCQKDIWEGKAGQLIERNYIGVRPVGGWWKHRPRKDKKDKLWDMPTYYSLIVSIETDNAEIDLYAAIENEIKAIVKAKSEIKIKA
ncbi:MAG: hypothetical protein CMP47_13060 [Rickettsiales bacterium]|nr:hypothetical protein [Rickettsiales bacterium]